MPLKRDTGDRQLVELCISRDLGAWDTLVSKYSRLVEIAASNRLKKYGFTPRKEDIADIRQDLFASIWDKDKLKGVTDLDDISHWLAVISGNAAIDHIRNRANKEQLKAIPIHEQFKERYLADLLPSGPLRTEDDAAETGLAKRIDRAMERLPCRERLVMELYLIHDKKHDEIAELLDLPIGTVCGYVKKAKKRLRTWLRNLLIIFAIFLGTFTSLYMRGLYDCR